MKSNCDCGSSARAASSYSRRLTGLHSATGATALDPDLGECGRIEQAIELIPRELSHLCRDFFDRAAIGIRPFCDLGGEVISDDRVERGNHDRIAIHQVRD